MKFVSKKDWWMALFLWGTFIFFGIAAYNAFIQASWINFVIVVLFMVLILSIWFGTFYKIDDEFLSISYGPYKTKIAIKDIQLVEFTTNPFTSTALSRYKINIYYRKYDFATVSPKDREGFIRLLQQKNKSIKIK